MNTDIAVAETLAIESHTQIWLDSLAALGGKPIFERTPADAREFLREVQKSAQVDMMDATIEDRTIPSDRAGNVNIRIVKPPSATAILPAVIHLHGGGWILGGKDTHERLYRELANAVQAAIVFVDYTPAPEGHYPLQNEQAYAALEWTFANAASIGADPHRIGLIGDSVGGNMAAAVTLMRKERNGPRVSAQVLFYPVTNAGLDSRTYRHYADGPWLTRSAMQWFWDAYLPDERQRFEATVSPLQAAIDDLRGMPPTLIINGEHDVLRDEGEAFGRRLMQAGVPVTQVRYGGTIHDFVLLNPIAFTPAPRAAIAQAAGFLRKALAMNHRSG